MKERKMIKSYFNLLKISEEKKPLNNKEVNNNPVNNDLGANNLPEEVNPINQINPANPVNPANQANPVGDANKPNNEKTATFVEFSNFGAWKNAIINLPQIKVTEVNKINDLAKNYLLKLPKPLPDWALWNGKIAPFKLFSLNKNHGYPNYSVALSQPSFFKEFTTLISGLGYDISNIQNLTDQQQEVKNENQDQNQEQQQPQQQKTNKVKAKIDVKIDAEGKILDNNAMFFFSFGFNQEIRDFMIKEDIRLKWDPNKKSWYFSMFKGDAVLPSKLKNLSDFMASKEYDVVEFKDAVDVYEKILEDIKTKNIDPNKVLVIEDVSDTSKFYLTIRSPEKEELYKELKDFIQFSFPSRGTLSDTELNRIPQILVEDDGHDDNLDGRRKRKKRVLPPPERMPNGRLKPTGMRFFTGSEGKDGKWHIFGDFDELCRFGILIKSRGWETANLKRALADLARKGVLEKTRFTGQLDGYPKMDENGIQARNKDGTPAWDYERFNKEIDEQISPEIKLFDKQKDGVRWLYERDDCILGDDTGTGKTITTLAAAKLRLNQSGGRALIITLSSVQRQWKQEIINKLKEKATDISFNPEDGAKWTIISYSDLKGKPEEKEGQMVLRPNGAPTLPHRFRRKQPFLDALFNSRFTVGVFDEAHMLKNSNTGTSIVVNMLSSRISFKWGATATPIANTTIDLHNILEVVGHSLGRISTGDFNREFVGKKVTTRDFKTPEKAQELMLMQQEKAYNLKKWLVLSGAYLSRSKRAMNPNLPDHIIGENYIDEDEFNMQEFIQEIDAIRDRYNGNMGAVLAQLTKTRTTLARMKVPHSLNLAKQLLDQGEKVLVFSNFVDTSKMLFRGLDSHLKQIDPELKAVSIMDGNDSDSVVQAIQDFKDADNPARAMVISSKKGGTGVSLENSTSHVIMNDFDWSPYVAEQTEGRAFRINNFMPVDTKYMVVKSDDGLNPDEIFYNYVRAKIRISSTLKNLDDEAEEYFRSGLNMPADALNKIVALKQEDAKIAIDLQDKLREMAAKNGRDDLDFAGAEGLDDFEEFRAMNGDEEDGDNQPKQAFSWYERSKTGTL